MINSPHFLTKDNDDDGGSHADADDSGGDNDGDDEDGGSCTYI